MHLSIQRLTKKSYFLLITLKDQPNKKERVQIPIKLLVFITIQYNIIFQAFLNLHSSSLNPAQENQKKRLCSSV